MYGSTGDAHVFTSKSPTAHRTFLVFVLSAIAAPATAAELTEAEVIRLVRSRDPGITAAKEAGSVAEAEETRAALYPNPTLGWDREHLPAGAPTTEDSFYLTLPIDFTGRRPAARALARAQSSTARAKAALVQTESVLRSLEVFYDALAARRNVEILARAVSRLDEAARVVKRRQEAGTSSGYEQTRLEVEAELARSALRQAEAEAQSAKTALATLLAVEEKALALRGEFSVLDPKLDVEAQERASLRHLREAEARTQDASSAADWAWVPTLAVTGGLRIGETTETRYGYVAGVSMSLPVFSRGQEIVAESDARSRLSIAETAAAKRETLLVRLRAREQLLAASAELERFQAATAERVQLLEKAAEAGYREGDRSVVELVDAQRARTEIDRRILELGRLAKRAELELRAARGEFE